MKGYRINKRGENRRDKIVQRWEKRGRLTSNPPTSKNTEVRKRPIITCGQLVESKEDQKEDEGKEGYEREYMGKETREVRREKERKIAGSEKKLRGEEKKKI